MESGTCCAIHAVDRAFRQSVELRVVRRRVIVCYREMSTCVVEILVAEDLEGRCDEALERFHQRLAFSGIHVEEIFDAYHV